MSSAALVSLGNWADSAFWWVAIALFLALAAIESVWPEKPLRNPTGTRWAGNFALYAANLALVALTAPSDLAAALFGTSKEWSLFALLGSSSGGAVLAASVLLPDLLMYAVHRAEHRVFLFWRFHAVHHADTDVDIATGIRHHPGEFVLNSFVVAFVYFGFGAPAWVMPIYGLMFLSGSVFQHLNSPLPARLERLLGLVLVTPGMHRVHHSSLPEHYGTNFGAVFSFWDRLCGTYLPLDQEQREALTFGIPDFTAPRYARVYWAWILPLVLSRDPAVRRAKESAGASVASTANGGTATATHHSHPVRVTSP